MSLFSIFSKKTTGPASVAEALASVGETQASESKIKRTENRQSDMQNAQLVPEKKRARRRLIGAVVIVLVVVVGLPMVFDSEPKPINKNIIIQIPSRDAGISSIDSQNNPGQDKTSDQNTKPPVPERIVTTVTPSVATPSTVMPPKSDIKSEGKAADQQHIASNGDSARAVAILNGADISAKPTMHIVIQVGAFATQKKVNELQDKLTAAGIQSFTQKIATSSGDKIRVRIGPFSDKESADKAKLQLEKIGLNASLISL